MTPRSALLAAAAAFACLAAPAFAQGIERTELKRSDLTGTNMEIIVAKLTIMPGGTVPRHTHPGDESLYVLEGGEMTLANGNVAPFPSGVAAHFPRGMVHGGLTNNTDKPMVVITTHIVDKGVPMTKPE